MNLKEIKDYPNYSFDLDNNMVYSHYKNRHLKYDICGKYYSIQLYKNKKKKKFDIHRLVYEAHNGIIPIGYFIDHKNNDRTNNNIENLRLATHSENSWNRKAQKNNLSTGYKNISLTKFNSYNVQIRKYKKLVYCKTFKTLEEAINNRDIQLKKFHKEFCNF